MLLGLLLPLMIRAQSIAEKSDELLTAYTAQQKFSGTVLIAKEGRIVFQKAYGMADRQKGQPNTVEGEFRAGSLTKMFTATAVLQLAAEEKLSLTDPVSRFVPQFPNGDRIRVEHLLSHTSGIKGGVDPASLKELAVAVKEYTTPDLEFEPGTHHQYNNYNYILLSYIAEKVSGQDLPSLLQAHVFAKAGMQHTGLDYTNRSSAQKTLGYVSNRRTAAWEPAMSDNVALASGAGALYTTAGDLYRWSQAIPATTVLPAATWEKALTPVKGSYGMGWMVNEHNGHRGVGHTGSIEGFIAYFMKYPKDDATIIFLSNYGDTRGQQLANDLTAVVFGEPYNLPTERKVAVLAPAVLEQYIGVYELKQGFRITVSADGGKLLALAPGDKEPVELTPESETKFFLKGPEIEIEFLKEDGAVKYMVIKMGGGQKLVKVS
jgi:CubicO group peptidase (beta-lactamase class C family)